MVEAKGMTRNWGSGPGVVALVVDGSRSEDVERCQSLLAASFEVIYAGRPRPAKSGGRVLATVTLRLPERAGVEPAN